MSSLGRGALLAVVLTCVLLLCYAVDRVVVGGLGLHGLSAWLVDVGTLAAALLLALRLTVGARRP
ncbi:hypothetical protein PZ938_01450 [Luteipulveratus sp. YIM 133132]|uniref:hypothetical protein n=1 Tax=Luteipulveratus flavus TaxID=3031728 RepID=UPI0023B035EA|nr:hypothetical protein [Luteipulveratus sp. YIM 133132]MDE9364259.1 hypothetical protein [Luteipulveratus sp. YIM 133132]